MPRPRVIVLKFGGSVLQGEDRLRIAVHEIYRWRREGWRVVAVVSAFAGETDALLAEARAHTTNPDGYAIASLAALGEHRSAALLGLHLDRAGVPACVLTPGAIGLRAEGNALDADPRDVDERVVRRALDSFGVVVVPGFVALDRLGRHVTLGRGGSDLTALALAHALGADRCRLLKDVDGLYDSDPNAPGSRARRYECATYQDALATDGSIVQHKAVRYAQRVGLPFELGAFNGVRPTLIGAPSTRRANAAPPLAPLTVALLGHGVVGGGVRELLEQLPEHFTITSVLVRDPSKHPGVACITRDAGCSTIACSQVVVEQLGGLEPAGAHVRAALLRGAAVVTANKALLASEGAALTELAEAHDTTLLAGASVGGALPVLERLRGAQVASIRGVLNGTANFVLDALHRGASQAEAIAAAQSLGFAEADPSRDLDGRDALDKLIVIAGSLGIDTTTLALDRSRADVTGHIEHRADSRLRQVATLEHGRATIALEAVGPDDALFDVPGEWNAVEITFAGGSVERLLGRGAGRWPTAEAVVGDLLEIARRRQSEAVESPAQEACHA